ncbi:metallophosphoesterase family protein [Ruania suaedae]|uniref:metallophosphoesterase family protein n=1 Tax=Ruania suaedae TaxID=2897774 RepID=UPI001E3DE21E|nr:metallophosphoesterase [Ruania suaedae]UFU01781.1 metallophosphoesterase family protein [Ruania suaedae]
MTRRTVRASVAVLVAGVLGALVGVLTASYTGSLGPHAADYSVRLSGEIRVDMGPLGALIVDSPLPANLGADVVVKEIPAELSTPGASPIAGLTADLESYVQFLANPQAAIDDAIGGLVADAVGRAVLTWSVLLVLVALGRLAAHGVLRDAVRSAWSRTGVPALSVSLALVLAAVPVIELTRSSGGVGRTSTILAGTPLAEARITGRLATLVDHYGTYVVDAIEDNTDFYATARENLLAAYATDPAPTAPTVPPTPTPTPTPAGSEDTEEPGEGGTGDADAQATPGPEETPSPSADGTGDGQDPATPAPLAEESATTALLISDLHCNIGMAEVVAAAATVSEADVVLNAGDTVMGGTAVESYCVNAFGSALPPDVPVVVADGNHDSRTTTAQEEGHGWTVLQGEAVEVAGLRILGDTDPTLTSLGAPTRPQREETINAMGNRLAQTACDLADQDQGVDLLLVHSPYAGRQTVEAGCAPLTISGHLHRQVGPRPLGWGIQYLSASSAGAGHGTPTIGPLNNPAVMTVLRFDTDSGLVSHYRLLTVGTDAGVELSEWMPWPQLPADYVDAAVDQE